MRWSLFSLVALLAILISEVTALPTPRDGSSELSLERQALIKRKAPGKAMAGSVKASNFKQFSQMYRNAAPKGKNHKYKAPKRMPKGKNTYHTFEVHSTGHPADKIPKVYMIQPKQGERMSEATPYGLSVL